MLHVITKARDPCHQVSSGTWLTSVKPGRGTFVLSGSGRDNPSSDHPIGHAGTITAPEAAFHIFRIYVL
jgi:hypothetical protein